MSWRPEKFKNPYKGQNLYLTRETPVSLRNGLSESAETVFEAGADAMLEALRKADTQSHEVFKGEMMTLSGELVPITAYGKSYKGKMVFIPDMETE